MKFSITTPSFNGLSMLKKACGSVRSQNGIEREHIVQDGMSSDGTPDWLRDFQTTVKPLTSSSFLYPSLDEGGFSNSTNEKYSFSYVSEKDDGMYDAINKGWQNSTGDILSWLNCDEQYLPGTLAKVQKIFEEHPDVDVVYGNALFVDGDGQLISVRREIPTSSFLIKNTFLNAFSCTTFFRKKLLEQKLLELNDEFKYAADMDMMLNLLSHNVKMYQINDFLSLFTCDGNNLSLDQQMADETQVIQKKYGALPSVLRKGVKMMRCFSRLIHGHYLNQEITYKYATNETPDYIEITGKANGKFSF